MLLSPISSNQRGRFTPLQPLAGACQAAARTFATPRYRARRPCPSLRRRGHDAEPAPVVALEHDTDVRDRLRRAARRGRVLGPDGGGGGGGAVFSLLPSDSVRSAAAIHAVKGQAPGGAPVWPFGRRRCPPAKPLGHSFGRPGSRGRQSLGDGGLGMRDYEQMMGVDPTRLHPRMDSIAIIRCVLTAQKAMP